VTERGGLEVGPDGDEVAGFVVVVTAADPVGGGGSVVEEPRIREVPRACTDTQPVTPALGQSAEPVGFDDVAQRW
jgi:hypothetical protein